MKRNKLKLTLVIAAMAIALGGGYLGNINFNRIEQTVYAEDSIPCDIQNAYLEQVGEIKAGNTIYYKISMNAKNKQFNGVCIQLKYDSNVFENIEVIPGEICTNSENTFVGKVNSEKERISIFFADSTGENKELVNEDGEFAVITLKVKDNYNGSGFTDLILRTGFASDINEMDSDIQLQKKDTTIKDDKDDKEDIGGKEDPDNKDDKEDKDDKENPDHKDDKDDKEDTGNKDDKEDKDDKGDIGDKDNKDNLEETSNIKINIQESNQNSSSMITPIFTVTNNGTEDFNLSNLKFNYYYTKDSSEGIGQIFNCYYSGSISGNYKAFTSNIVGTILSLSDNEKSNTADSCMQISFNGGVLDAGQSMMIQTAINKSDWSCYDLNNDYSYNNKDNLSIYINNKKVN